MEPIAIVGMACRFPAADGLDAYWRLLRDGVDAVTEVPPARWDAASYYDPRPGIRGKMNSRWGGFLADIDRFDADFFGVGAREARFMDPQQRLLMELAWEAIENSGKPATGLAGTRTGVFIGIGNYDYNRLVCRSEATLDAFSGTGTILAIAANRLSYFLGLRGPSMAIDTACSSSLVALHLACQSLVRRETDLAIVGGVNLILSPEVSIILSQGGMLSPVGRCRVFDAAADGYVRSEGCAVVVLKRLHEALAAGDNVLAVVRGTAVNHDGRTHGLTVTSAAAQQAVIGEALDCAGVAAADVSCVEAHTPGTPLMDLLEIRALKAVLLDARPAEFRCALGSVKTNIGNTEAASGMAGLVKVVLSLQNEWIPAHLHLNSPNPRLRLDGTPLYIPAAGDAWPRGERRRYAGVSAFGLGGTNAHVVLEEAPAVATAASTRHRTYHLLTLSAHGGAALRELALRYQTFLDGQGPQAFADMCFTASNGRAHFSDRLAFVADQPETMRGLLRASENARAVQTGDRGRGPSSAPPRLVFVFGDADDNWAAAGHELYRQEPVFRSAFEQCDEIFRRQLNESLVALMVDCARTGSPCRGTNRLEAATFAFQYALTRLWRSWGIEPSSVLGCGAGEYAAAWAAGVYPAQAVLSLIAAHPVETGAGMIGIGIAHSPPAIGLVSGTTGGFIGEDEFAARACWPHRPPGEAKLRAAMETLRAQGPALYLEIDSSGALREEAARLFPDCAGDWQYSIARSDNPLRTMLEALAGIYVRGADVDWAALHRARGCRSAPLPGYPFQRRRYWFDEPETA